jgi:hypothetical protein
MFRAPSQYESRLPLRQMIATAMRVMLALCVACILERPAAASQLPASAVAEPLVISLSGNTVHIGGVTPNGQVALVSVMREASRTMLVRMTDVQELLTDHGTGAIDFDLGRPVPARSIWAAVDLSSGRYMVTTPAAFPRQELPFPAKVLKNTPAADTDDELLNDHFVLYMLWVHVSQGSQAGAWFTRVADGGSNDLDTGNDGRTLTRASQFEPLGASGAPPKKIKKDDVLVMLDPFEMQFFATVVR